jgi:hypothetical protein
MRKLRGFLSLAVVALSGVHARAHDGPPYAILMDRDIGFAMVNIWADPDVGTGTFYMTLDPPKGGRLPGDTKVTLAAWPRSESGSDRIYDSALKRKRNRMQFEAEVPFAFEGPWIVRFAIQSAQSSREIELPVEVTPPGNSPIYLLWYFAPIAAIGFLWLKALLASRQQAHGR